MQKTKCFDKKSNYLSFIFIFDYEIKKNRIIYVINKLTMMIFEILTLSLNKKPLSQVFSKMQSLDTLA